MIDLEILNTIPVNKKAKEMLGEIGITAEAGTMHCIQLAKWGYEQGGIEVDDSTSETIEAMLSWRLARIANFFMIGAEKVEYNPPGWQEAKKPHDLAQVLINDIEEKISIHFPWYGSM